MMKKFGLVAIFAVFLIAGNSFGEDVETAEQTAAAETEVGKWIEVEGAVVGKTTTSFHVGSVSVAFSEDTEIIGDLTFHNNDLVRVQGTLTGPASLKADKIEIEDITDPETKPETKAEAETEEAESDEVETDTTEESPDANP